MHRPRFKGIRALDVSGKSIPGSEPTEDRLGEAVFRVLERNELCSIATTTPAGHPHINTAYYSYSHDLELYFLSHPSSLHCRNLSNHPSMAMTVFSSAQLWTEPGEGLQLFGTCGEATGPFASAAEHSYAHRFPAYERWRANLKHDDPGRQYRFYRFRVTTLKMLGERDFGDAVFVIASLARREPPSSV